MKSPRKWADARGPMPPRMPTVLVTLICPDHPIACLAVRFPRHAEQPAKQPLHPIPPHMATSVRAAPVEAGLHLDRLNTAPDFILEHEIKVIAGLRLNSEMLANGPLGQLVDQHTEHVP